MNKTITPKILLGFLLTVSFLGYSQESPKYFGKFQVKENEAGVIRCASKEEEKMLRLENPALGTDIDFENWLQKKISEKKSKPRTKSSNAIKTIPVVVHVIHNGDAIGSNENISLEQVLSQIEVLNEDFRQLAGTNGEDPSGLGVDTQIQFCLAKIDPTGQPTNGVERLNLQMAQYTSRDAVQQMKSFTQWDPEQYLNIWTVSWGGELSNLLGYAQFPIQSGLQGLNSNDLENTDGVVISYRNFGSVQKTTGPFIANYNLGRTTTHEVGHFLGLRHIWGDADNCQGNDFCNDTPIAAAENTGCPTGQDSCPQPGLDMIENYMDYTFDFCMHIFTPDQLTRMETVLENSPRRASLLTSTVCGTLGTPEFRTLQGINVYPNPAQNVLTITTEGDMPDSYTIFNSIGQTVATASNVTDATLNVNVSGYANGIYFIKVDKGSETKTIKFIKN